VLICEKKTIMNAKNMLKVGLTISSIFRIDLTVSVAKVMALTLTKSGWITFSSKMSEIAPLRTLIPAEVSPLACRFLNSVTV
jgi:hypothetical protein